MNAMQLSIPLSSSSYLRTFEAEIDVTAENEIFVRGVMSDHRFAFEHTWKVRTPVYEIVTATATQIAGDKADFDPELCNRYSNIAGIRIGRGFSKGIVAALGNLPGANEHLLMAIDMARVAQQVYQYTPEFDAQFPYAESGTTEAAYIAWQKDREYMNLGNSCYAYRNETEALFAEQDVLCGFDPELTRPKPGDKRVFWRSKSLSVQLTNHGYECESFMQDRIHDIKINFDLSREGFISNARSRGLRLPYHGICETPHQRTPGLNGVHVTEEFIRQFADQVGGASGCTHLFDLSIDCLRLFRFED